jgi:hypothetical protein
MNIGTEYGLVTSNRKQPMQKRISTAKRTMSIFGLLALALCILVIVSTNYQISTNEQIPLLHQNQTIRLVGHTASATAFFELTRDFIDLTVILADPNDDGEVVRSGARMIDGQTVTFVYGGNEEDPITRTVFTFKRDGFDVLASHNPAGILNRQLFASVFEGSRR